MSAMFSEAKQFNQPIENWNTGRVINMNAMFSNATSFNQNISNWNVSNVTIYNNFATNSALTKANAPSTKKGTKFPTTK